MTVEDVLSGISILGFAPAPGASGVWRKSYGSSQYTLKVIVGSSPAETRIDYGDVINAQCGRDTTRNFSQAESLVVLECVDTFLTAGYDPSSIHLERQFTAGQTHIWLDLAIVKNGEPYLFVDCKTWGSEFNAAKASLFSEGGQLVSYYINDRRAKFIAYYASRVSGSTRERQVVAVDTGALPPEAATVEEISAQWDKSWFEHGLVESAPYQIQETRLSKADLRDMTSADRGRIFNGFSEILRRHVVSDKPNAFNKLFNLFICKIFDEEKNDEETLEFQWSAGEDSETVLSRLLELYRRGMSEYLAVDTPDLTGSSLAEVLQSIPESQKAQILEFIGSVRTYGTNEFSFKDVYDRDSYAQNVLIVREVVRLLQPIRLRYGSRQAFLGEFFENLLNLSVKQEAGQFFTPIPITRFIVGSLPFQSIIARKIDNKEQNFLPYIIDFASGSGHFVTTAMEAIDNFLQQVDPSKLRQTQRKNHNSWKESYKWAGEFLYAIEKDYRLAKASKVSCFLHGDGEANIIHADGLDNFGVSRDYHGRLKLADPEITVRDNPRFDVVVANPPYAVEQCRATVPHGQLSFELFEQLSDSSSAIEALFVERMKQLLRPGGVAGIILPSSILSSSGIEGKARRLIFDNFLIRGIVAFKGNTFMATATNTVVLFLEKRAAPIGPAASSAVREFFETWADANVGGINGAFGEYAKTVWGTDLAALVDLLRDGAHAKASPIYREYEELFEASAETKRSRATRRYRQLPAAEQAEVDARNLVRFVRDYEAEKMKYFIATCGQQLVLVRAPSDPQENKQFLGYEFSKRRGREGLRLLTPGELRTPLFNDSDWADPTKISSLLRQAFSGQLAEVPTELREWTTNVHLPDLIDFDRAGFRDEIRTAVKKKHLVDALFPCFRVKEIAEEPQVDVSVIPTGQLKSVGKIPVISQDREFITGYADGGTPLLQKDLPLILYGDHTQVLKFLDFPCAFGGQGVKLLRPKQSGLDPKLLYHLLRFNKPSGAQQYQRHFKLLRDQYIPLPTEATAGKLLRRCDRADALVSASQKLISSIVQETSELIESFGDEVLLSDLCTPAGERVEPADIDNELVNYVGLEDVQARLGLLALDWEPTSPKKLDSTKWRFEAGDILFGRLRPYLAKAWFATCEGICSTEFSVLRPQVAPEALTLAMLHPAFIKRLNEQTRGQARPRLKEEQLMRSMVFDIRKATKDQSTLLMKAVCRIQAEQSRQRRLQRDLASFVDKLLWRQ